MKIKVSRKKIITFVVTFVLIICLVACHSIPINAMSLPSVNTLTSGKLIDMCLTRSGKIINGDMRDDVLDQARNVLNNTAQSYWQWCEDNNKAKSVETLREYMESDSYASLPFRLSKLPLELASFIHWIIEGETLLDYLGNDVNKVLVEEDDMGNVVVPSETVNIINQCFDEVKGDYTSGWYYLDTKSSSELKTSFFGNQATYQEVKNYINSSDRPTFLFGALGASDKTITTIYLSDNEKDLYTIITKGHNYTDGKLPTRKNSGLRFQMYNENWNVEFNAYTMRYDATQFIKSEENLTDISNKAMFTQYHAFTEVWYQAMGSEYCVWDVYTKNGESIIVYTSLDAIKNYSVGNTPYYLTNRQYSDSVDNSFNVSGEYLQNNGGNFSYEQIREQINNSNVTNDNSASSIINDYSQTIINNYNYSSGSGDGGNSGGSGDNGNDSDNSILDGIGKIFSAISEIIGFLLGIVGDVITLFTSLLTTVLEMIKSLGALFGSFSGLIGELFTFIPKEYIDLLEASMSIMVVLAIWKMIRK